MDHNGVVVNTSDFHSSNRRSFPGRREYNLLFNVDIVSLLLKNNGGRERQKASISYSFTLEYFNYWRVGDCGLGQ